MVSDDRIVAVVVRLLLVLVVLRVVYCSSCLQSYLFN